MFQFLSNIATKFFLIIISLYSNVAEKCKTCKSLHYDKNMYYDECEKCAFVRWHKMPKKCNFKFDLDIHNNDYRDFSEEWCTNDTDTRYGMCRSCSIKLYKYLSKVKLCLRKFLTKNDDYSLCLTEGRFYGNDILLCKKCNDDKDFSNAIYKLYQKLAYASDKPENMMCKELSNRYKFSEVFVQKYDWGHILFEDDRRNLMKSIESGETIIENGFIDWPYIGNLIVEKVSYLDLAVKRRNDSMYTLNDICFECYNYEYSSAWTNSLTRGGYSLWTNFLRDWVSTAEHFDLALSAIQNRQLKMEIISTCRTCRPDSDDSDYELDYDTVSVNDNDATDAIEEENYEPEIKRKRKSDPLCAFNE